ncbi:unnamed protein product [Adineta steineri]|nr:unnamed protein product [Adineta steineri]
MFNNCPGYLDSSGVWNNGFSCQPVDNRIRTCCGPENRRECCFADQLSHQSDLSIDSDLSSSSSLNKNTSSITITPSSYILILTAIGLTLVLLIVLLIVFAYMIRRKLKRSSSSSSSSCSSDSSSINKHSRRLSIVLASSSKSGASSPVPSTYVDYWSRTIVSPSEWTLSRPYNSFIGAHHSNNQNYYIDQ